MANVTEGVYRISVESGEHKDQSLTPSRAKSGSRPCPRTPTSRSGGRSDAPAPDTLSAQAGADNYAVYDDTPALGEPITLAPRKRA